MRHCKCQQKVLRLGVRVNAKDVSARGLREACASACLLHVAVSLLLCRVGADVDDDFFPCQAVHAAVTIALLAAQRRERRSNAELALPPPLGVSMSEKWGSQIANGPG